MLSEVYNNILDRFLMYDNVNMDKYIDWES